MWSSPYIIENKPGQVFKLSFLTFLSPSTEDSGYGGLSVGSVHLNGGVIAGSVIAILFILACIATITGINLAVCFYIAVKSKRSNQGSNVTTENRPFLLVSTVDEVDKPSSTPPTSSETSSEEIRSSNADTMNEKEREAMEQEEEQRYQPQEAIFVTPSKEPEGDVKA